MRQLSVVDVPYLGAEGRDKFGRMRDDTDCASPFFDGDGETTEGFSVQEIGRFVEEKTLGTGSISS